MGILDWFASFAKNEEVHLQAIIQEIESDLKIKALASSICVNLIANTVSRAEFLTYQNGKEVRDEDYFDFNLRPNPNKNAIKFWKEVVAKMLFENQCLVIQKDGHYYMAETFTKDQKGFSEATYKDITVSGRMIGEPLRESEVIYLSLHSSPIDRLLNEVCKDFSKLVNASKSRYKKNGAHKAILKTPGNLSKKQEDQEAFRSLVEDTFKKFFEAEGDAIMPLNEKYVLDELENNIKIKGNQETREIRSLVDDIFDFVALAFQIPPQLLKGSVADTDKAFDKYLTYCINPICKLIECELNGKLYGKKAYLQRTFVSVDTTRIRHVDISDIASSLDILTRIGANTINDNLRILGREQIKEKWGDERFMTKNYEKVSDLVKGGEK